MKEFEVWGEHITLGQLLKVAGVVDSGGEVRYYLSARPVMVNGQPETRRGRKLVPGDRVTTPGLDLLLTPEGSTPGEDQEAAGAIELLYEKPAFQPPAHIGPPARRMRRVMRRGTRQTIRRNVQQAGPQTAGRGKEPVQGGRAGRSSRPGPGAAEPSADAGAAGTSKPAASSGGNTPADPSSSHASP